MDVNKIRQGDNNAAQLLVDSDSSLVQAHAVSDPIFSPIRKLPTELLAKIFIESIPSLVFGSRPSFDDGMYPQQVRARLGQVCRMWNAILTDEPGVWATLVLDHRLPALEIVSLWIKRSKSHPLDVSLEVLSPHGYSKMDPEKIVVKMLHRELWRIRSLFAADFNDYYEISSLFPPDLLTVSPMMQSLTLESFKDFPEGRLGCIHCPQLRTLTLRVCSNVVESLISKPMQNLRVLAIVNFHGDNMLYIKLLQALPNLVSLTWSWGVHDYDENPRVALPSLKSLAFRICHWEMMARLLRQFDVPSLEHLEFKDCFYDVERSLNTVLDVICGDRGVQLRRLTLGSGTLTGVNLHAMWHHLNHLETLFIGPYGLGWLTADELFITLSPPNRDFSSVCPQLKTLELDLLGKTSTGALVDFVQRRVKSDLGDPAPGSVTCLKLWNVSVDKVSAQLAKTHSLFVHCLDAEAHHVLHH